MLVALHGVEVRASRRRREALEDSLLEANLDLVAEVVLGEVLDLAACDDVFQLAADPGHDGLGGSLGGRFELLQHVGEGAEALVAPGVAGAQELGQHRLFGPPALRRLSLLEGLARVREGDDVGIAEASPDALLEILRPRVVDVTVLEARTGESPVVALDVRPGVVAEREPLLIGEAATRVGDVAGDRNLREHPPAGRAREHDGGVHGRPQVDDLVRRTGREAVVDGLPELAEELVGASAQRLDLVGRLLAPERNLGVERGTCPLEARDDGRSPREKLTGANQEEGLLRMLHRLHEAFADRAVFEELAAEGVRDECGRAHHDVRRIEGGGDTGRRGHRPQAQRERGDFDDVGGRGRVVLVGQLHERNRRDEARALVFLVQQANGDDLIRIEDDATDELRRTTRHDAGHARSNEDLPARKDLRA